MDYTDTGSILLQYLIIIIFYIFTLATSGMIVELFIGINKKRKSVINNNLSRKRPALNLDTGTIIGKCKNILTLTLILLGAYTGLALIFTAKSIIRADMIKKNPKYYLGGTLVNFTYSILVGLAIITVLKLLGIPFKL
ncbi:MAG: hypothetical protein U9O59_08600 [Actinomycetota bacterium]|nr:hypothetical protein [Actinomycetota bacterium]